MNKNGTSSILTLFFDDHASVNRRRKAICESLKPGATNKGHIRPVRTTTCLIVDHNRWPRGDPHRRDRVVLEGPTSRTGHRPGLVEMDRADDRHAQAERWLADRGDERRDRPGCHPDLRPGRRRGPHGGGRSHHHDRHQSAGDDQRRENDRRPDGRRVLGGQIAGCRKKAVLGIFRLAQGHRARNQRGIIVRNDCSNVGKSFFFFFILLLTF